MVGRLLILSWNACNTVIFQKLRECIAGNDECLVQSENTKLHTNKLLTEFKIEIHVFMVYS